MRIYEVVVVQHIRHVAVEMFGDGGLGQHLVAVAMKNTSSSYSILVNATVLPLTWTVWAGRLISMPLLRRTLLAAATLRRMMA